MEQILTSLRFRANLARDRRFLPFHFTISHFSALCQRGLSLGFFVNLPLARFVIVADIKAFRKTFTRSLPATHNKHAGNTLPGIAAGEAHAMNRCIDAHGPIVWAIVKRYIKDNSEAEDLVQEIFTEVWKKAAAFDPAIASEATFVGMIARRRAIDSLRRLGRQPQFETLDAAKSLGQDSWDNTISVRDPEAVKSSIATLPTETRELFHLYFEDGFTHPEIAEKTGLPLGTIKTRLRRGLMALREILQHSGKSNPSTAS